MAIFQRALVHTITLLSLSSLLGMGACGGGGGSGSGGNTTNPSASSSPAASSSSSSKQNSSANGNTGSASSALSSTSSSSLASSASSSSASATSSANNSVSSSPSAPLSLQVPALAYDDNSITLVWKKPASYADIVDYNVYMNGEKSGSAASNNTEQSPAKPYIDAFYAADTNNFHTRIRFHNYRVTGLSPDTQYSFSVRSVDAEGRESVDSAIVVQKTAPAFSKIVDITSVGASTSNSASANTTAIQSAIDSCAAGSSSAYGCKVLVPAGSFQTGAIFLKSNMTLELANGATLKGSANASDYPLAKGYQLYSFFTNSSDDRRPPSLLNLLNPDHMNGSTPLSNHQGYDDTRAYFSNVRVVGQGTLDGNGWASTGNIKDETGNSLPQYFKGNSGSLSSLLAKSQVNAGVSELGASHLANVYSNRRSSLATFRGVSNMYFGGLTLRNPAYHGVMFLESENVAFAYNTIQTYNVNNGDGVEFGNSDGATIFANFFDCGDDNINFAAGQGSAYAAARPQENAWIFNNYMRKGHGGVVGGSHTGAWIQDILAEDNVMNFTEIGLRMKSTPATGGGARRITFRDNVMKAMSKNAIIFTLAYSAGSNSFAKAGSSAQFRDFSIQNVTIDGTGSAAIAIDGYDATDSALGYAETFQENLSFDTLKITHATPSSISRLKNSSFRNITVSDSGSDFWKFSNSSGNTFSNVISAP